MTSTLLVCSGGGHLKQLHTLAERMGIPRAEQTWVTFDNALSRSILADREVIYAPFAAPRDALNILRIRMLAKRILRERSFERAISTGSSPAVAFLPLTRSRGIPSFYIESAARADGPSVSGRLITLAGGIPTFTQYPAWASERWQYRGSIFDAYQPVEARTPRAVRRAVVSVGTQDGYRFDRLYRSLVPLLADCDEVLWQTGPQDVTPFGITGARASVPHRELSDAVAEADVVIAHSGTGAAITALEHGKFPVLVPRRAAHREHVDDHQLQIGAELQRRDLAIMREADQLTAADLEFAASRATERVAAPPFVLDAAA
ncbi:glycosyltransferase [Agromyces sp. LHK192]|uniref:glycosyltransferase n=1 Tax=Agromyces sp. LHK192 TaxID=2498704 RepID=UPI000FD84E99|nr:glycosyltransferase [Agromyces sp. LHK192]